MSKTRVIVIGGGALGFSTALHLAETDEFEVTVLESQHIAEGSSSRSIGIVETQYMSSFDIAVRAFGLRFVGHLAENEGLTLNRNGYLRLASNDAALEAFQRSIALQREQGITGPRVLIRSEVEKLIPQISLHDRVGALYGPSDGYLDGHLYTNLLADLARRAGATVLQQAALLGAEHAADGTYRLQTRRGKLAADIVVNAAGGWAGRVGDLLDAPVEVKPQRHQAITVALSQSLGYVMPSVMDYVPGSGNPGLYFRHENIDKLFAGLHIEEAVESAADPDTYFQSGDQWFAEQIAEALASRLPGLEGAGLGSGWAGIYPMSTDHQPIVGPHPENPSVLLAVGAGGNGIQLSPAIGKTVSEYLTGRTPSLAGPGSPWDAARIARSSATAAN
ncbi:MAG: FAD-dependent oxidoreductase [Pseudonocardiaceae bacterium]|nr:FAD-dependent oxidoreductase [Pseudonocardiaceae bacterium]